jgi:hypothetical protein
MTEREWPAETKTHAEKAMADLEAFYDSFAGCTPFGRKQEMNRLSRVRFFLAGASGGDPYIEQKLTSLEVACKRLALQRRPAGYDENAALSQAGGAVRSIRAQLHGNGLVEHYSRPSA